MMKISLPSSTYSASRLAFGTSRQSIRNATTQITPNKRNLGPDGQPPGHGQEIWLINHTEANHTVYSFKRVLNQHKALKQIPFNGKKLKPAKLRKDYWRPMAMVQFPDGYEHVGRSVFQKLREFRARHELEWGSRAKELRNMNKWDRGRALNDQKATAIADMAAVLSGVSPGNKMWSGNENAKNRTLHPVRVFWANELDKYYARDWSDNVKHIETLPEHFDEAGLEEEVAEQEGISLASAEKSPALEEPSSVPAKKSPLSRLFGRAQGLLGGKDDTPQRPSP